MKLATIIGQNGEIITLGTGNNGRGDRILTASNGDEVHPNSKPYRRDKLGTAQAINDIESMWGRGPWNLDWADSAISLETPEDFTGRNGYKED